MAGTWSIVQRIAAQVASEPSRPALTVDGETWSYADLWALASSLAAQLPEVGPDDVEVPATALMAHRHVSSYAAVLACLVRGHTWVPVNVEHPDERNLAVLRKSRAQRVICGEEARATLTRMLAEAGDLTLDVVGCRDRRGAYAIAEVALAEPAADVPAARRAYVLFTSGSTGEPKGVPIHHGALTGYLDAASSLMPAGPDDRFSQTFELTFDLSIHDVLLCWTSGAHLVVPTREELSRPADYLRRHAITRWFSVPSLAYQMRLQGDLQPGSFPTLRTSLFCGEALPALLADEWANAAPNSVVENWYGPTEATIACARYVLPPPIPGIAPAHDLVPIGDAFEGMALAIHGDDLAPVPDGTPGELLLSGRQLSEGYLDDPERNARAFVRLPGRDGVFYRTGDRAVRDPGGPVRFLGRVDNQVKVRGFRIELGEIEAALRKAAGGVNAVAMSWPPDEPSGRFVVAALETAGIDATAILEAAAKSLPDYMLPAQLVCLPAFPKNASGKADRKEIARRTGELLRDSAAEQDLSGLKPEARRLMEAVLAVSPALTLDRVLKADTLMDAGMDSLSFISLTAEIERLYARTLEPEEVVRLSLLSFDGLLAALMEPAPKSNLKAWFKGLLGAQTDGLDRRTNRALQFIAAFPAVLEQARKPLVIALGSSGTFRALSPDDFEDEARRLGHDVTCLNVGLAGVGLGGIAKLAAWIARTCEAAHVRPAIVLYELDPAQVSTLPGRGDARLPDTFFDGRIAPYPAGKVAPEFEWSADARGTWIHDLAPSKGKRRPNWERERDMEVARIFAGDVEFVPAEFDAWIVGARALQRAADRTLVFIHPANRHMLAELPANLHGERFETVLKRIEGMAGLRLLPPAAFELDDADFLDINHVNPHAGRPKLSRQLARRAFA